MPSKYVIRNFSENNFYHIFNRGVEKRKIFLDEEDYNMFLFYVFIYVAPLEKVLAKYPLLSFRLQSRNLSKEMQLVSYCLMPNHYHLLIKQIKKDSISKFIKQLTNAYTLYFNQKYKRVGGLMQGRFKAVNIENDDLLLHISRYIHLNPIIANLTKEIRGYKWSSLIAYLDNINNPVLSKDLILSFFRSRHTYKDFILDQIDYAKNLDLIKHYMLEE